MMNTESTTGQMTWDELIDYTFYKRSQVRLERGYDSGETCER